jgi:hypothetical protein
VLVEGAMFAFHAAGIASIDLFVVRTISFKLLYGLVILRHARRARSAVLSIRIHLAPSRRLLRDSRPEQTHQEAN